MAGAGFYEDFVAIFDKPANGLGHEAHPPLSLYNLLRHPNLHAGYYIGKESLIVMRAILCGKHFCNRVARELFYRVFSWLVS